MSVVILTSLHFLLQNLAVDAWHFWGKWFVTGTHIACKETQTSCLLSAFAKKALEMASEVHSLQPLGAIKVRRKICKIIKLLVLYILHIYIIYIIIYNIYIYIIIYILYIFCKMNTILFSGILTSSFQSTSCSLMEHSIDWTWPLLLETVQYVNYSQFLYNNNISKGFCLFIHN